MEPTPLVRRRSGEREDFLDHNRVVSSSHCSRSAVRRVVVFLSVRGPVLSSRRRDEEDRDLNKNSIGPRRRPDRGEG